MALLHCPKCSKHNQWTSVTLTTIQDPPLMGSYMSNYVRADQIDTTEVEIECKCGAKWNIAIDRPHTQKLGVSYRKRIAALKAQNAELRIACDAALDMWGDPRDWQRLSGWDWVRDALEKAIKNAKGGE